MGSLGGGGIGGRVGGIGMEDGGVSWPTSLLSLSELCSFPSECLVWSTGGCGRAANKNNHRLMIQSRHDDLSIFSLHLTEAILGSP